VSRTIRHLVALIAAGALILAGAALGVLSAAQRYAAAPLDADGVYTMLLIGSDDGPPRNSSPLSARADALHVLVVSEDRKHVTIMDIPRDAWIDVPGRGTDKINSSLNAGPENVVTTIENWMGVEIDNWILSDFQGFVIAIDELGGVEISVEQRLNDPIGAHSNLYPGPQTLRGLDALSYVRDRKSRPDGDFGRARAQSDMLQALHEQIRKESPGIRRLAQLLSVVRRTTVSDISATRMLRLAYLAMELPPEAIAHIVLPGTDGRVGSAAVTFMDPEADAVIADVIADGVLDDFEPSA